jgi:hypothetical protein
MVTCSWFVRAEIEEKLSARDSLDSTSQDHEAAADSARPTCRAARAVLPTPPAVVARADPGAAAESARVPALQLSRTCSPRRISLLALTEEQRPSSGRRRAVRRISLLALTEEWRAALRPAAGHPVD